MIFQEMDTITMHLQLEEKERSVEMFINILLQIIEKNLKELIILLELSENENVPRPMVCKKPSPNYFQKQLF